MLAMSLCMTGSDLNSSSKPWTVQKKTSDIVYAEFHEQVNIIHSDLSLDDPCEGRRGEGAGLEANSSV